MSNFILKQQLKSQQIYQEHEIKIISEFVNVAERYVNGQNELSVDFFKNIETQRQLDIILGEIQVLKERIIKSSRYRKPKSEIEKQYLRGAISHIVGNRKAIVRKLNQLAQQVRWLKRQKDSHQPSGRDAAVERTVTLVSESITIKDGKAEMLPGQGIVIAIAMLFTVFIDIKLRRSKSKIGAEIEH